MKKGVLVIFLILLVALGYFSYEYVMEEVVDMYYLASSVNTVKLYNKDYQEVLEVVRGANVLVVTKNIDSEKSEYQKVIYKAREYYVKKDNLSKDKNVVLEDTIYIRTPVTVYKDTISIDIFSMILKGSEVKVIGYDKLNKDGSVNKYKVLYKDIEGYIYSKYTVDNLTSAQKNYDNGSLAIHNKRTNKYGGGDAASLDYYPYEKVSFEDNVMPSEVRSLYLNVSVTKNIDEYIDFALKNNINSFVIDIKENTVPAYKGDVFKKYSITNYNKAKYSVDEYKSLINKAQKAGIYLIARISTFKDGYYVKDHPEDAILDKNGQPYKYNSSYWPTAYNREVWEFNVALAIEAVELFGFNEIQFDYVRFPDRTYSLEKDGTINLNNTYSETKAQAIQTFLMYACDEIHRVGAYVSADVFGETANSYVTGYGQYWPAISNVVDVISAMPYPDHFNAHEYGIDEYVWEVPYKLLKRWGSSASIRQKETTTPAIVRTWIQAYNSVREPYVVYDAEKVSDQIRGLYENDLIGGYMTWNSASSLNKYREIKEAFKKEY